jgi:hypothetical protein
MTTGGSFEPLDGHKLALSEHVAKAQLNLPCASAIFFRL